MAADAATGLPIALTTPSPKLAPVLVQGTAAPSTLKFFGAGLFQRPVKLNEAQFDLYCIVLHYYINCYKVSLPFLLLHCYYIIVTYYYIIHYYISLHFVLLHCDYIIMMHFDILIITSSYQVIVMHYYIIITSLFHHY